MKKCPNCGASCNDDAKFCTTCGNSMEGAAPVTEDTTVKEQTDPVSAEDSSAEAPTSGSAEEPTPGSAEEPVSDSSETTTSGNGENNRTSPYDFASQQEVEAPPKKKKGKYILIFAILAAVLACGIGAFAMVAGRLNRAKNFWVIQAKFFGQRFAALKDVETEDQIDSTYTLSVDTDSEAYNKYLKDSSLVFQLKADQKKNESESNLALNLKGSNVLNFYTKANKDMVKLASPELSEKVYSIKTDALLKKLGMEDGNAKKKELENLTRKELLQSLDAYFSLVKATTTKDNLTTSKGKLTFTGFQAKEQEVTIYSFRPSKEDVEAFTSKLKDKFKEGDPLYDYLLQVQLGNVAGSQLGMPGGSVSSSAKEEAKKEMDESFQKFCEDLNRTGTKLEWNVYAKGDQLLKIEIKGREQAQNTAAQESSSTEADGKTTDALGVYSYEYWKEGDQVQEALTMKDSADAEGSGFVNEYSTSGDQTKGEFHTIGGERLTLSYEMKGDTKHPLMIPYGTYQITYEGKTTPIEVTKGEKGDTNLVIKDLDLTGGETATVTLNGAKGTNIKAPTGEEVDMTNWDDAQYTNLANELSLSAQKLALQTMQELGLMGNMLGGNY
ncbi:MAG: hypothetical protein HXK83_10670 [Lachnospiraceae bacterium]|nr:hypothetical protein [Lachnospiraceae bacterium]